MRRTQEITVNDGDSFARWLRSEMKRTGQVAEDLKRPPMITASYIRMLSKKNPPHKHPSLRAVITLLEQMDGWTLPDPNPESPTGPLRALRAADPHWPDDQKQEQEVIFTRQRKPAAGTTEETRDTSDAATAALNLNQFLYKRRLGQGIVIDGKEGTWRVAVRTEGDSASPTRYFKLTRLGPDHGQHDGSEQGKESFEVAVRGRRAKDNPYPGVLADFDETWKLLAEWVADDKPRDALMAFPPALIGMFEAMGHLQLPRDTEPRPPRPDLTPRVRDALQPIIDRFLAEGNEDRPQE